MGECKARFDASRFPLFAFPAAPAIAVFLLLQFSGIILCSCIVVPIVSAYRPRADLNRDILVNGPGLKILSTQKESENEMTLFVLFVCLATNFACRCNEAQPPAISETPILLGAKLPEISAYDFASKSPQTVKLPKALREISGLTFTEDGRLLCHNDESGTVFEVNYQTGEIVKRFYLGRLLLRGDFEGIAARQDTVFLVNSEGVVHRFREAQDEQHVDYQRFATKLSIANDVEGLAYDSETESLLLACKADPGKGLGQTKAVYAFSLKTRTLESKPRFLLSLQEILSQTGRKEFNPSAIERHPGTGHFFVLASNGLAIAEIDSEGKLLAVSTLPKSVHDQPEGLAIAENGTLIIANEGAKKSGTLVIYPPQSN